MIISGYQVHTGSESYDVGCNHTENCREGMSLEEIGQSCSTIFLRIEDNKPFCPSIDGANWGGDWSYGNNNHNNRPIAQPGIDGNIAIKYEISLPNDLFPDLYRCTHHECDWRDYKKG